MDFPIIAMAAETAISPKPLAIIPLGINCVAPAMATRDKAIPVSPLMRLAQEILPIIPTALLNIITPVATAIKPIPLKAIFFGINFIAPTMAINDVAIPNRPLIKESQDKEPIDLTACPIITTAVAIPISPTLFTDVSLGIIFKAPIKAARATVIPTRPLANSSQDNFPIVATALDNIRTAALIAIIDFKALFTPFPPPILFLITVIKLSFSLKPLLTTLLNTLNAVINIPNKDDIAIRELNNLS